MRKSWQYKESRAQEKREIAHCPPIEEENKMKTKILSLVSVLMLTLILEAGLVYARDFQEIPFGLSNPYDEKDLEAKNALPEILKDLGLSEDANGAGFVVDVIGRKKAEVECDNFTCQQYDFSQAKDLIDLVAGQGKTNLWVVIGSPSNYKFTDGKERSDENKKTYLPDGPVSRKAYRDYLLALVNYVNDYGRKVSGKSNWYVVRWNLYNEPNADYNKTFGNIDEATTSYANFVIDSAEILKRLSPKSKIVLAGSGNTDLSSGQGKFHKLVFSKLKKVDLKNDLFDYWESHWFGESKLYAKNIAGYGVKDFIGFLKANGYSDKKFLIRAGGTYSGQDLQERKGFMNNYQSEQDQAGFLVKRFIYNLGAGVKYIAWSTIYERDKYQGEKHVHFQYISLIYDGYPDGKSKKQKCIEGWLPCPDPGKGIKKLSYYTYKKLIETLKGSDWDNIRKVQGAYGIYTYKFIKNGKNIWVAWSDNEQEEQITISDITSEEVKITEAIPKYESGKEVIDYNTAFNAETKSVTKGKVNFTLIETPVFIEEK